MTDSLELTKLGPKTLAEVAALARLSPEAVALAQSKPTPRQYVDALLAQKAFSDVLRFLAMALPVREGIWWGSLCLKTAAGDEPNIQPVLTASVTWILQPTEEHRQAAALLSTGKTADAYLARAIAWTGGSLTPQGLPVVAPGPDMPLHALAAAIQLAVTLDTKKIEENRRKFLVMGIRIARGKHLWPIPPETTKLPTPPLYPPGHRPSRPPFYPGSY